MSYFDDNNDPTSHRIASALSKLGLAMRHHAWRQAAPSRLTPTQGQILSFLSQGRGATLGEVAEALAVRPATASDAVRVLVEKGLVDKSRHPDDARARWLVLTPAGAAAADGAGRWPEFLAPAVDALGDEERRVLLRAVLGLIRELQVRGQIPTARMCITCRHFRPRVHDDPRRPHHCALVDAAFGDGDLRPDCAEHEAAPADVAAATWRRFSESLPPAAG